MTGKQTETNTPLGAFPGARLRRRRFLGITAAAGGLPLLPFGARGEPGRLRIWTGVALGADAMLQLHHPDPEVADRLIAEALAEVRRLEAIMSLYRPDSALVALNRRGELEAPPPDLVRIFGESAAYHALTGGMFDITVQPLWELYAGHFGQPGADPDGPPPEARAAALAGVGFRGVRFGPQIIRFLRPGMGVTLNSIAQGYITDRVVELLRARGITHALVDMGKIRAIGPHPSGTPWRVGLEDPRAPGRSAAEVALIDRALGTAGGYGTVFDAEGRFCHIFNPFDGSAHGRFASVSVIAPTATEANVLSTTFTLLPLAEAEPILRARRLAAHFVTHEGERRVLDFTSAA
jgi:thiamine biosynthesis lipoprotein